MCRRMHPSTIPDDSVCCRVRLAPTTTVEPSFTPGLCLMAQDASSCNYGNAESFNNDWMKQMENAEKTQDPVGHYTGLGVGLGAAFGAAFGTAFEDSGTGLAIGVALGAGIGDRIKRKQDIVDKTNPE